MHSSDGGLNPPEFFWWPDDKRCPLNFEILATPPPLPGKISKNFGNPPQKKIDKILNNHLKLLSP